jgi:hypothetical protein
VIVVHHVVDFASAAVRPRLAQALAVAHFAAGWSRRSTSTPAGSRPSHFVRPV